jgi:hypothetical protein
LKTYISKKHVIAANPGLIPGQASESGYFIPPLAGLDPDFRRGTTPGIFYDCIKGMDACDSTIGQIRNRKKFKI